MREDSKTYVSPLRDEKPLLRGAGGGTPVVQEEVLRTSRWSTQAGFLLSKNVSQCPPGEPSLFGFGKGGVSSSEAPFHLSFSSQGRVTFSVYCIASSYKVIVFNQYSSLER